MTGREFKLLIEAEKLQHKAEPLLLEFLKKHKEDGLIFENTSTVRNWLWEVYPDMMDETEHDEELILAFIAGMMFVMINSTSDTGIRWIYTLPPVKDEEEGDETENE